MIDITCKVEVGTHVAPYWIDKNSSLVVCNRHMVQYLEREDDLGPFDWQQIPVCIGCGTMESVAWWKCCPEHTSAQGPDIVCDDCRLKLHPPKLMKDHLPRTMNGTN